MVNQAEAKLRSIPGDQGKVYWEKFEAFVLKNPGRKTLKMVVKVLTDNENNLPGDMEPGVAGNLRFVPLASVNVERSFSIYKNILGDKRQNLTKEYLSKIIVTQCYTTIRIGQTSSETGHQVE